MSETPRTDALLNNKEVVVDCAFLDFARQLERELAAKDKEIERLQELFHDWKDKHECFSSCAFFALKDQLAAQEATP